MNKLLIIAFFLINLQDINGEILDLAPAKWIWYPSARTLQNTFILFRKVVKIDSEMYSKKEWIIADSRYHFLLMAKRVQWGPAPSDPRWQEADSVRYRQISPEGEECHFLPGPFLWIRRWN
jgi:hypothetical protein